MNKLPVKNPVKIAFNAIYVAFVLTLAVVFIRTAILGARSLDGVRPDPVPLSEVDDARVKDCLRELESLDAQLRNRVKEGLSPADNGKHGKASWEAWAPQWRTKLLETGARCRLEEGDVPASKPLCATYEDLQRAHRSLAVMSGKFDRSLERVLSQLDASLKNARDAVNAN